jgi:hypothetical protein
VLAGRIRDRLSTLRELYGEGPLERDRAAGRGAAEQPDGADASHWRVCGEAEYVGELGEFVPYLKAGKWVGWSGRRFGLRAR